MQESLPPSTQPPHVPVTAELPEHAKAIEALTDLAFGPDRLGKTTYRLREDVAPIDLLSLVVMQGPEMLGTIRYWPVKIPAVASALLLGPIAIHPDHQGCGIGSALMTTSLQKAKDLGWDAVILVGDEPYYRRFGFRRALAQNLTLPGPVDQARLLGLDLADGALKNACGMVERAEG